MTKDEILAMQPSREMDWEVRHKVFGIMTDAYDSNGELWTHELKPAPRVSTDISAAWEVEAKIKELGLSDAYGNRLSRLIFFEKQSSVDTFDISHASAALRCKAALIAVMEVSHDL